MKIVTASNGKKVVKISKAEWVQIGKTAGWLGDLFNKKEQKPAPPTEKYNPMKKTKVDGIESEIQRVQYYTEKLNNELFDLEDKTNQFESEIRNYKSIGDLYSILEKQKSIADRVKKLKDLNGKDGFALRIIFESKMPYCKERYKEFEQRIEYIINKTNSIIKSLELAKNKMAA